MQKSFVRPAELPRSHPGKVFTRHVLANTQLTRKEIAERLGMSQDYLNRFIDGLEQVTIDFANKLEAEFSISA